MTEILSIDNDRLHLVTRIVHSEFDRQTNNVIEQIRCLPRNCRQFDENDAGLSNVWEEFKYQFQMENSTYRDFYESSVRALCEEAVNSLTLSTQQLLWLWTEDFGEKWVDLDDITMDDWDKAVVVGALYQKVCDVANNQSLEVDPFEEEARLRHEEDNQWFFENRAEE